MTLKKFLKTLGAGILGAGIFFMLSIFAFALTKIIYLIAHRDLLLSQLNILVILAVFVIVGFIYGIASFVRKNSYHKVFKIGWTNFLTTVIVAAVFTIIAFFVVKGAFGLTFSYRINAYLFLFMCIMMYVFSSLLAVYFVPKRQRVKGHKGRNLFFMLLFNPIFIMIYLWLFLIVVWNSMYIPCGVVITGVDKNMYTANTANLGIKPGERIMTIDDVKISSLNDVRNYINNLQSSKQVTVETDANLYYVNTYMIGRNRFMGLLLKQAYCERQ
jgi:hypothetical protein